VSVKDVAVAAGVSLGTVSNVLNRPDAVSEPTRDRVLAAMSDLGFVRNESARMLRSRRSSIIALVVLDVGNPFFTDVIRGAEAAADRHGYSVVIANSDDRPDKEERSLQLFEEQRVAGLIITPTHEAEAQLHRIARRGTPVVLLDRDGDASRHCSVVVRDELGGFLAGQHLRERGHKRLGFVGGPFTLPQVRERYEGFVRAAGDVTRFETSALTAQVGYAVGRQLADLPARRRPTAVLCANDLLALGVLQALTARGLDVPRDVAVVGYDDIGYAAAAAVPLSSVRQPRDQLGEAAVQLLLEEVAARGHVHRRVAFDPELVVRASSG
jgi:LacI family transcriptional regulator